MRLDPYHVVTNEPALLLQRDREPVRDQKQLLRPRPPAVTCPVLGPQPEAAGLLLHLPALVRALAAPVRVPDVDPQRARLAEQCSAESKDLNEVIDKMLRMVFEPELPIDAIVALTVVWWGRYNTVHLDPGID